MGKIVLVTGGARSGKSTYAEKLARECNEGQVTYVATAQVFDEEMKDRVKSHRERRPESWTTIEAPFDLENSLKDQVDKSQVILIDCVTVYISNKLMKYWDEWDKEHEEKILKEIEKLGQAFKKGDADVIFVSNEVGFGLVPENKMGRIFRDMAGRVNQVIAEYSDEVYLVVAGIPKRFK